jgi:cyclophilin family peptidyl-prolyl cis-trans isomerase
MNRIIPVLLIVALLVVGGIWLSRPNLPVNASLPTTTPGTVQAQTDSGTSEESGTTETEGTDSGTTDSDTAEEETTDTPETTEGAEDTGATDSTETSGESSADTTTETTTDEAASEATSETTEETTTEATTETEATPEAVAEPTPPEGFAITPFLSEDQQRDFTGAEQVLEEGKDYQTIIVTNKGNIRLDLFEEQAPVTVNNFVFLARNHFYDGVVFHRVLQDFMAQTGDPTGTGTGGPGYQFEDEFVDELKFDKRGVLAMANSGPATNGSQFFITFAATEWLNGLHSIFGEVVEGDDVLASIKLIDPSQGAAPPTVVMLTDTLESAASKGITLAGEPTATLQDYLTTTLGNIPDIGAEFEIDGLKAISGRMGETPAIGFLNDSEDAATPDVMQAVYIIEKAK